MEFAKLHSLGNDFLVAGAFGEEGYKRSLAPLARDMCRRHRGVGADGVLFYHATVGDSEADYSTLIFNRDGSRAEMSGNGIRCLAAYLRHTGECTSSVLRIRTVAGIKVLTFLESEGATYSFESSMGSPILEPTKIPVTLPPGSSDTVDFPLRAGGEQLRVTATSMGNPHCSTFWEDVSTAPVSEAGPLLESHEAFPNKTNVEFIQVLDRSRIRVRFWERGVGPTRSSGTGSSAAAVASILRGLADTVVQVETELGSLQVRWEKGKDLLLRGVATFVFNGRYLTD